MATPLSLDDIIELNEILDQLEAAKHTLAERIDQFMQVPVENTHVRQQALVDVVHANWQFDTLMAEFQWQLAYRRGVQ
jgi:hypothetical protein